MSRSPRRGVAVAAVVLAISPLAAACGTGGSAATLRTRPDNPEVTLGALKIQDVVLVQDVANPQQAALNVVITNQGAQAEELTGVTLSANGADHNALLHPATNPATQRLGVAPPAPLTSSPPAVGVPGVIIPAATPTQNPTPTSGASAGQSQSPATPGLSASPGANSPSASPNSTPSSTSTGSTAGTASSLSVPGGGVLSIGMPGAANASFSGLTGLTPGSFATVTLLFASSGQRAIQVPVLSSTGAYASITPAARPSASPTPSGSAGSASPAARARAAARVQSSEPARTETASPR